MNCDGTGVINRVLTTSGGATVTQVDDFIITRAIVQDWYHFLAIALVDAVRTPSAIVPGGIFLTRSYTRLPDRSGAQ